MSGKSKRRRSASMKQLVEEGAVDNPPPPKLLSNNIEELKVIDECSTIDDKEEMSSSSNDSLVSPKSEPDVTKKPTTPKSTVKIKSSRRASFQLANTVNNLAKESGVDHLIGIVNESGEKKVGMKDQIKMLKDEIDRRGLTQYIDVNSGYSMSGEIKMLKKVLNDHVNINVSQGVGVSNSSSSNSTSVAQKNNPITKSATSSKSPGKGGSENMVKLLAELRDANEKIMELEKKLDSQIEMSNKETDVEEQLCELEDQLLKANKARVDGIAEITQLQKRIAELEKEVHDTTEEATATIQQLEECLDDLTTKYENGVTERDETIEQISLLKRETQEKNNTIAALESQLESMSVETASIRLELENLVLDNSGKADKLLSTSKNEEIALEKNAELLKENTKLLNKIEELNSSCESLEEEKLNYIILADKLKAHTTQLEASIKDMEAESDSKIQKLELELVDAEERLKNVLAESTTEAAVAISALQSQIHKLRNSLDAAIGECADKSNELKDAVSACSALEIEKLQSKADSDKKLDEQDLRFKLQIEEIRSQYSAKIIELEKDRDEALERNSNSVTESQTDSAATISILQSQIYNLRQSLDTMKEEGDATAKKLKEATSRCALLQVEKSNVESALSDKTAEQEIFILSAQQKMNELNTDLESHDEILLAKSAMENELNECKQKLRQCEEENTMKEGNRNVIISELREEIRSLKLKVVDIDHENMKLVNDYTSLLEEKRVIVKKCSDLEEMIITIRKDDGENAGGQLESRQHRVHENDASSAAVLHSDSNLTSFSKEEMQNDINVLLSKMAVAEKNFESIQNEHESEVLVLQCKINSQAEMCSNLENELKSALTERVKYQELLDEQNVFLKEAAESLDKSDEKYAILKQQLREANQDILKRSESADDVENILCEKESKLQKLSSDNEFLQKRLESLQRKVIKLNTSNTTKRETANNAESISRLRALLVDLKKKNDFLVNALERESKEKFDLKRMLSATYSDHDKFHKSEIGTVDSGTAGIWGALNMRPDRSTAGIWGAMNKRPALVGYDIIFKQDSNTRQPCDVEKLQSTRSIIGSLVSEKIIPEVSSVTSFLFPEKLATRMSFSLERLLTGWFVLKLSAESKPRVRLLQVDTSTQQLFTTPINANINSNKSSTTHMKKSVSLSSINTLRKDFDIESTFKSRRYTDSASCMLCICMSDGGSMVLLSSSEEERNDLFDCLTSLLVKFNAPAYINRLIDTMNIALYQSSLYIQSVLSYSTRDGQDIFEVAVTPNESVAKGGSGSFKSKNKGSRRIVTKKGSENTSNGSGSGLTSIISSINGPRKLSIHYHDNGERLNEFSEKRSSSTFLNNAQSNDAVVDKTTTDIPLESVNENVPSLDNGDNADKIQVETISLNKDVSSSVSIITTTKTPSVFSVLYNNKETVKPDIEIDELGKMYGNEKTEDRKHSVNLSNDKGKRRSSYSFVSENPFSLELENHAKNNVAEPKRVSTKRRISGLFTLGNTGSDKTTDDVDIAFTRQRGLSAETIAKANSLSISFENSEVEDTDVNVKLSSSNPEKHQSNASKISKEKSQRNSSHTPFSSTRNSPVSVGAENAKRFGKQKNLMRTTSGPQSTRARSNTTNTTLGSRTTLMNVDSESLEILRHKARRRASASREFAAQTNELKRRLSLRQGFRGDNESNPNIPLGSTGS